MVSKQLVKKLLTSIVTLSLVAGCATKSGEIMPTYVSPLQYSNFNCDQIRAEAQRIHVRASQMTGIVDEKAQNANVGTAVAVVLFWPAAFWAASTGATMEQRAELARLKGEQEALAQAAIQNKCQGIVLQEPTKPKPEN